jgi:hypothetical protein
MRQGPVKIPDVTPEAREFERRITLARTKLSTAWIAVERIHPILAAHRGREGRHLEWIDLGAYSDPIPFGDTTDTKVRGRIFQAEHAQRVAGSPDTHERAVMRQTVRKLANIRRARLALASKLLSPLTLAPVVRFTEKQLLIAPRSAWAAVVREVVEPEKGVLAKGLEFIKEVFDFAVLALSALPNPLAPAAVLWDIGRNVYVAAEEYVKQDMIQTLSDTDLDVSRSLSDKVPSLTGFVVALAAAGMSALQLKAAFQAADLWRRRALRGVLGAWEELEKLGKLHNIPGLADDVARAEGITLKGGKSTLGDDAEALGKGKRPPVRGKKPPPDVPGGPVEPEPTTPVRETRGKSKTRNSSLEQRTFHGSEAEVRKALQESFERLDKRLADKGLYEAPEFDELLKWLEKNDAKFAAEVKLYYDALGDPKFIEEQALFLWNSARKNKTTVAAELERLVGRGQPTTKFRNTPGMTPAAKTEEFREAIAKPGPFEDLAEATSPHGSHTHMFQEFLGDRLWKRAGAGRKFRLKLATYKKGPGKQIFPGSKDEWTKPFWSRLWDEMFDGANLNLHRPENLGDILHAHLDFPEA